jgi:hypothetical protein
MTQSEAEQATMDEYRNKVAEIRENCEDECFAIVVIEGDNTCAECKAKINTLKARSE